MEVSTQEAPSSFCIYYQTVTRNHVFASQNRRGCSLPATLQPPRPTICSFAACMPRCAARSAFAAASCRCSSSCPSCCSAAPAATVNGHSSTRRSKIVARDSAAEDSSSPPCGGQAAAAAQEASNSGAVQQVSCIAPCTDGSVNERASDVSTRNVEPVQKRYIYNKCCITCHIGHRTAACM